MAGWGCEGVVSNSLVRNEARASQTFQNYCQDSSGIVGTILIATHAFVAFLNAAWQQGERCLAHEFDFTVLAREQPEKKPAAIPKSLRAFQDVEEEVDTTA